MFGIKKLHKALNFIIIASIAAASIASTAYAGTIDNMDYIVHAGGQAGDDIGTNSLEAINNSFLYGYRYIEIDFNFTSDGKLVCVHDWDTDYFRMGKPAGKVLSSEEFDNAKVLAKYTTMTAEELAQWLYQKPNTYVITDIKENNIAGLQYLAYNCGYKLSTANRQTQVKLYDLHRATSFMLLYFQLSLLRLTMLMPLKGPELNLWCIL